MASRLDSIQVAIPRSVDAQQQQHAAQRQPVVAQEHAAAQVQQNARAREQRPEAPEGAHGGKVRNELLPEVEARQDPQDRSGKRRLPRRRATLDDPAPAPAATAARSAAPPADGRGSRVDIRL